MELQKTRGDMDFKPWMENITAEDMPNEDLQFLAQEAGVRYALMFLFLFPGLTVTIPKNPFSKLKENYIVKNYDGTKTSINRLAIECDLSQRHVYRLIEKNIKKAPASKE